MSVVFMAFANSIASLQYPPPLKKGAIHKRSYFLLQRNTGIINIPITILVVNMKKMKICQDLDRKHHNILGFSIIQYWISFFTLAIT